jgi:Tol biopolymer transport system component
VVAYRTLETIDVRSTDARVTDVVPEFVSPDGFLYFSADAKGTLQIWRQHPDGSGRDQVTSDAVNNAFPQVSPDGRSIAFLSWDRKLGKTPDRAEMQLRLMSLTDKSVRVLATFTGEPGSLVAPAWSLDGRRIGFTSYQRY